MTRQATSTQLLLARLALALIIGFALLGLLLHGFSAETRERVWQTLAERPTGPMAFRFFLQPTMAAVMAAIDGFRDARSGASPYFWALVSDPARRGERLHEGLVSTARILLLGLAMDLAYQIVMFEGFYPGEAAVVAVLLAFVPYLLLRGPFARLGRWWGVGKSTETPSE